MHILKLSGYYKFLCLLLLCLGLQAQTGFAQESFSGANATTQAETLVAIADIHGAYSEFTKLLVDTSLVDENLQWSGGQTWLVIVGDVLDRGPDSRKALDLIIRLEQEALEAGGKLQFVLGNHEIMNIVGDLRYVSAADFSAYVAEEDPAQRAAAFLRFQERFPEEFMSTDEALSAFEKKYPPGFFGHRASFSADGIYGKWLLGKPFVEVINRTVFMHAGMAQEFIGHDIEQINQQGRETLSEFLEYQKQLIDAGLTGIETDVFDQGSEAQQAIQSQIESGLEVEEALQEVKAKFEDLLFSPHVLGGNGVTWYRGMVSCSPAIERSRVVSALQALGADRLIIGHTPTSPGRVLSRFEEKLIRADTGMLGSYYGGNPAAVIIEENSLEVIYSDPLETTTPEPQPRQVASRPYYMSDEDLETLLLNAEITGQSPMENDGLLLTLDNAGKSFEAIFTPAVNKRKGRMFIPEVAAYRIDKLLNLDMVPVSVMREIDGVPGAINLATENFIDDEERIARRMGGSAWCPLQDQFNLMYIFDSLISNSGRTRDKMRYDSSSWQLILTGNHDILDTQRNIPAYLRPAILSFSDTLLDSLNALNSDMLETHLADVLDNSRRRALLRRRDVLLKKAEENQ